MNLWVCCRHCTQQRECTTYNKESGHRSHCPKCQSPIKPDKVV